MTKKAKKERRGPVISPLSLLRPRLDGLINNPGWIEREAEDLFADLDVLIKGIKPTDYLPVLVKSTVNATPAVQTRMTQLVADWVARTDDMAILEMLVERGVFTADDLKIVQTWLHHAGIDALTVVKRQSADFFDAYYGVDDLGSQGLLIILWYSNRQHTRVAGLNFLVDFNPPWEGAFKDIMRFPQRSPQDAIRQYVDMWRGQRIELEQIDALAAKQQAIALLELNRARNLRLPRDLIAMRDQIVQHVLGLPDGSNTPTFSVADFDELCQTGQPPENIRHFEQTVGRRVRLEDGKELFVMGGMDDFDDAL